MIRNPEELKLYYRRWIERSADLPEPTRTALANYIVFGQRPGSFLSALLKNDLRGTVTLADKDNMALIWRYITLLYHEAPSLSYGSEQNFNDWIANKGMRWVRNENEIDIIR